MNILIAGDGKLGATLTRQLSAEGHALTLIDAKQSVLASSEEQYDVLSVLGNCASMETLRTAEVEKADLLIAATSRDEVNLLCCMTAHGLNPKLHTIARIRTPEYLEQTYAMRDLFALSLTVNPEKQAAAEIARLIRYPGFLMRSTFAKGRVEIVELRIDAGSLLDSVPLNRLDGLLHCQVLVCTVLRDGTATTPDGSFVLRQGDRIFVTATPENLELLLRNLGILSRQAKRVLLAGGGRVSFYLAKELLACGIGVRIIERDRSRCLELAELLPGAEVICGDASSQTLLEQEGLGRFGAMVSLTGIDELNMVMSLCGSRGGVPQVITKLSRTENIRMMEELSIGSVVCPRELCSSSIARYVRAMGQQVGAAITVHAIADGQAEAMEFRVDETTLHCGEALRDLKLKKNVLLACITHRGGIEIPNGSSRFALGDTLIVVTSGDEPLRSLNDIFA